VKCTRHSLLPFFKASFYLYHVDMLSSLGFFLGFLTLVPLLVSAQNAYAINKIDIPTSDNGTATIVAGNFFLSFVNATVADGFDSSHTGSFEVIAGDKGSNNVVDIACVNQDVFVFACSYRFSPSFPAGTYHFRVNVTNDNNNSALSDTFTVTPTTFDCLTPPPPKYNITSTSDPNYRSLSLGSPSAGSVSRLDTFTYVTWGYVDIRNKGDTNISNLAFDFVSEKTGQAFGNHPANSDELFISQVAFQFAGTGVSVGAWRVRANYSNTLENGNQTVSQLSDLFYIEGADYTKTCDGLGKGTTSGSGKLGERLGLTVLMSTAFWALLLWVC